MNKTSLIKGYIYTILSAIIFGCMPLMAKYIYADGVNAISLVFLRNVIALPSLAILALIQEKTLKIKAKPFFQAGIPALFGCVLTPVLLFSSYQYLATGTATIFHFVYPSLVVLIGIFFFKKKPVPVTLISIVMCFAGILLFYNPQDKLHPTGILLSLASGLAFAVYVIVLPYFQTKENHGFYFSFYVALWSAIQMLIMCLCSNQLTLPGSIKGWAICILFALSVTSGAVVLFQKGTHLIGGEKSSILSTLEPITGVLIGILVFREGFNFYTILGSLLVIAASVLIAIPDFKKD